MNIHNCKEVNLDKKLGKYSLMKSALQNTKYKIQNTKYKIQNTKYGRTNKIRLEVFDD
jgi:hypothetical protein